MRKLFLLIASLSQVISTFADNALILELNDKTTIKYLTENLPVVSTQGENVVVSYKDKSTEYLISDVHKFYFGESFLASSKNVKNESNANMLISVSDTQIDVYGVDGIVSLFDMNGHCIKQTSSLESHASFDMPSAGVYVLSTSTKSVKIIVR